MVVYGFMSCAKILIEHDFSMSSDKCLATLTISQPHISLDACPTPLPTPRCPNDTTMGDLFGVAILCGHLYLGDIVSCGI